MGRQELYRRLKYIRIFSSAIGGFIAIACIAGLSAAMGVSFLIPPFGASCVIAFVIPESAFAQPRNIIGGHLFCSALGLICFTLFQANWWSYALAVSGCIILMQLTHTLHPPAAADPILLIMQGGAGWDFLLAPVLAGSMILVILAAFFNKFIAHRSYPRQGKGRLKIFSTGRPAH